MDFKEFTAGKNDDERRLDRVVRSCISQENLSSIYKAIRKGLIKVNGKKTQESYRVKSGDSIKIASILLKNTKDCEENVSDKKMLFNNFDIIFKNENFLVINKPYDMTVHGSENSIDKIVQDFYKYSTSSSINKESSISFTPGPLHRLDRLTTGVLFFSWSINGARWFCENMKAHSFEKIYLGIFEGRLESCKKWSDFIEKKQDDSKSFHTVLVKKSNEGNSKKALTKVVPLGFGKYQNIDFTLAQIQIFTGRTHQIRAQAASHGFPLLGDFAYGGTKINAQRQFFLHAQKICFYEENKLGLPKEIVAPTPNDFQDFLENHKFCDYNKSI